jgi:hypothetical protein
MERPLLSAAMDVLFQWLHRGVMAIWEAAIKQAAPWRCASRHKTSNENDHNTGVYG